VRSLTASVLPLIANPGSRDPGLRVVLLVDAGRRRLSAELARMNEYTIPRREVGVLLDAARLAFGPASLIGSSPAMAQVRACIHECSSSLDPVLIQGEGGAGKTHVARAIHFMSPSGGAFLPLSCAALRSHAVDAGHKRRGRLPRRRGIKAVLEQAIHQRRPGGEVGLIYLRRTQQA
jgi:DNA-binding NtrC family response regulator